MAAETSTSPPPVEGQAASSTVTTQALAEAGEGFLQPADLGGVARVEHAANLAFLNAQGHCEGSVGQPLLSQGLVEGRLGGQDCAGDGRRSAPGWAWRRNVLAPRNATRQRFLQAIGGFRDRLGERVAVRERLVEVREGDRETAFALPVEVDGVAVSGCHDRDSLEVVRVDAELLAHAAEGAGLEGLPAILHQGVTIAEIEGAVTALAPRAVEPDRDPVPARQLPHPRHEFAPVHGRSIAQKCTNGQGPFRAILCDLVKAGGPAGARAGGAVRMSPSNSGAAIPRKPGERPDLSQRHPRRESP